jgi:hypothetical protein
MEDDVWTLIKTVIPAVENRLKPHTQIDVATAHQVNVAPQIVNNHVKDEKCLTLNPVDTKFNVK